MAVLPKPKLIIYISRFKKFLNLTPTLKIRPKGQKIKMAPNRSELKINKFYNGRNRSRVFYNTLTWPFLWVRYGSNTVLGSTNIAYLNSDFGF